MKYLVVIVMIFFAFSSYGNDTEEKVWPKKSCKDVYDAIALFTVLADKEWKKNKGKEGAFYISVAADYAKVYETVCKRE